MSYGIVLDNYRRAGDYVSQILKGAKVANLPFQEPTRLTLSINLSTARAIRTRCRLRSLPVPMRCVRSGIAGCCARAASGHAAAAPPIILMNSRRLIASPKAQEHAK